MHPRFNEGCDFAKGKPNSPERETQLKSFVKAYNTAIKSKVAHAVPCPCDWTPNSNEWKQWFRKMKKGRNIQRSAHGKSQAKRPPMSSASREDARRIALERFDSATPFTCCKTPQDAIARLANPHQPRELERDAWHIAECLRCGGSAIVTKNSFHECIVLDDEVATSDITEADGGEQDLDDIAADEPKRITLKVKSEKVESGAPDVRHFARQLLLYPSDLFAHPQVRELLGPIPLLADLPSIPPSQATWVREPAADIIARLAPVLGLDSPYDLDRASLPDDLGEVFYETFGGTKLPKSYPPLPKSTKKKGPEKLDDERVVDRIGGVDNGAFILHQAYEKLLIHRSGNLPAGSVVVEGGTKDSPGRDNLVWGDSKRAIIILKAAQSATTSRITATDVPVKIFEARCKNVDPCGAMAFSKDVCVIRHRQDYHILPHNVFKLHTAPIKHWTPPPTSKSSSGIVTRVHDKITATFTSFATLPINLVRSVHLSTWKFGDEGSTNYLAWEKGGKVRPERWVEGMFCPRSW